VKLKKVNYDIIREDAGAWASEMYELLAEVRDLWHEDLEQAKIILAWRKEWKPDPDGRLVLGQCRKAPPIQRELADYDFVVVLNKEVWNSPQWDNEKKKALLDHELSHAAPTLDDDGEQKMDAKGRLVWRIVKHEIEEFRGVVERHGAYKADLEKFAHALLEKREPSLFVQVEKKEAP
jgi:hypothetical protein